MVNTLAFTSLILGVAGGDGELGCLCGEAGTSHLCDGSAHSSGCVVNGSDAMAAFLVLEKLFMSYTFDTILCASMTN